MPTTSELACSTATKTLARPSRMVIVCVMSVPHIALTLSVTIVPSCSLASVRESCCLAGLSRPRGSPSFHRWFRCPGHHGPPCRCAGAIIARPIGLQANHLSGLKRPGQARPGSQEVVYALFKRADSGRFDRDSQGSVDETQDAPDPMPKPVKTAVNPTARCLLRLANLPNYALDRLSRYKATLWRQAGQILFALEALDRSKPWERRRRFRVGSRQELPVYEPEEC
jgi:hypothetical protein